MKLFVFDFFTETLEKGSTYMMSLNACNDGNEEIANRLLSFADNEELDDSDIDEVQDLVNEHEFLTFDEDLVLPPGDLPVPMTSKTEFI